MVVLQNGIGFAAGLLTLLAGFVYVRAILRRETEPSRTSWGIWTVTSVVSLATYHGSGATTALWVGGAYVVFAVTVFALSIPYGKKSEGKLKDNWVELACLAGAAGSGAVWYFTGSAELGLYASVAVEMFAFGPICYNAYSKPSRESALAWKLDTLGSALNMFAINSMTIAMLSYPVAMLIGNALVVLVIYRKWLVGQLQTMLSSVLTPAPTE